MKLATTRFKEAVNKAIKGAGFNNIIPLTSMLGFKLSEGNLKLLTTDMTDTLCIVIDKVAGEDCSFTIQADTFAKLVSKITSDEIELTLADDILTVKANGTYKIPLVTDESGIVEFPDIDFSNYENDSKEVLLTSIMSVYNINKSSLAKTLEQPALVNYYFGEKVISTDGCVICFNDLNMGIGEKLISAQTVNLLTLNSKEKIEVVEGKGTLLFRTDDVLIEAPIISGIEDFPVNEINNYLDEAFNSSCKIPKQLLLSVLDRLALFIEPYDKNGAYFTFGRTGITIHSKKNSSTETINYVDSKNFSAFTCFVDIPMLKEQVNANPDDTLELHYGNENALKLVSGKITQIIALLEDTEA